jgi:hypothetical protein
MSSYALQVRFRHLAPSEGLIALAAARFKLIRSVLSGPAECTVCVESDPAARTHALVKVHERGRVQAEARASHSDPEAALRLALEDVQAQLGAASRPGHESWAPQQWWAAS